MYALILLLALASACAEESAPDESTPGGGGTGGSGGGGEEVCDDLSSLGACRFQGTGGGCTTGQVCTVDPVGGCGDRRCCTLPTTCAPPAGVRAGGMLCDQDDECASNVCVRVSGHGVCLRACEVTTAADSCPDGLSCATVALTTTRTVKTCIGTSEAGAFEPTRSVCRHDDDCVEGRFCRVQHGEVLLEGLASGLCVPGARPVPTELPLCQANGPGDPPLVPDEHGTTLSPLCPVGGICTELDIERSGPLSSCLTEVAAGVPCRNFLCNRPCRMDADCPNPLFCRRFEEDYYTALEPDLELGFCMLPPSNLPIWPCFDQTDCCSGGRTKDGGACCDKEDGVCTGTQYEVTHCRVEQLPNARWSAMCQAPAGLAALGEACADHAACESGLCAPAGTCASPCNPAAPGLDVCPTIEPGTQCCPTPVGEACVPACRADCDGGPTCTPS